MRAAGSAATPPTPARRVVGAQELQGQLIDGLRRWQRFPDRAEIDVDVSYSLAEDPVEAMTFLTAAIATSSSVTIERAPIEFLEVELAYLSTIGLDYRLGDEYAATNGRTRLADITTYPSELTALIDKIHPMPFPGINIDNLPFFALVGAVSNGETLIHDWVYENRMIYLAELARLGADVRLLDPHRLAVRGSNGRRSAR